MLRLNPRILANVIRKYATKAAIKGKYRWLF